jgi:hypothetical protein
MRKEEHSMCVLESDEMKGLRLNAKNPE